MTNKNKLHKSLIILGAVVVAGSISSAAPISLQDAQRATINWMQQATGKSYTIKNPANMLYTHAIGRHKTSSNSSTYRIIQLKPKGWVIVSSDDIVKPIIAYGDSRLDPAHLPPQFSVWMQGIDAQIKAGLQELKQANSLKSLGSASSMFFSQWKSLKSKSETDQSKTLSSNNNAGLSSGTYIAHYTVKPLLWMGGSKEEDGIRWDQGKYYNKMTPSGNNADGLDGHAPVGCVATAVGQVLRYYGKPTVGNGYHEYDDANYGYQYAEFSSTAYEWSKMPFKLDQSSTDDEVKAVATLLYHIGVSVEMQYGKGETYGAPNGSAAGYLGEHGAANALKNYFGYSKAIAVLRQDYGNTQWQKMIQKSLDNKNPILYGGFSKYNYNDGHAFVLDGYSQKGNETYYHFNWGYSGYGNGNFTLENLTPNNGQSVYSQEQRAVFVKGAPKVKSNKTKSNNNIEDSDGTADNSREDYGNASNSVAINNLIVLLFPALEILLIYRREKLLPASQRA